MKCVIDMQGAQGAHANRGIGRYTVSLVRALLSEPDGHAFHLLFSNAFPHRTANILKSLGNLVADHQIHYWSPSVPCDQSDPDNADRFHYSVISRELMLEALEPDIVLVTSMFEGFGDDCVTSIKALDNNIPVAAICYDLIPHLYPDLYLQDQAHANWYKSRLQALEQRADLILAISESTRRECLDQMQRSPESVVNISTAADAMFQIDPLDPLTCDRILQSHGITREYILYTGGIDVRKNVEGLIVSYSDLNWDIRKTHQLVIVCSVQASTLERLHELAQAHGLRPDDIVFTGYIPDTELLALTSGCKVMAFPSWHEGFGLPVLEAMCCGRAVIASNSSSLIEVVGNPEALFEPRDRSSLSALLTKVLINEPFRQRLEAQSKKQARNFAWNFTAQSAINALVTFTERIPQESASPLPKRQRARLAFVSPLKPIQSGIADHSAEILPELSKFYDIDVVTDQASISDPFIGSDVNILSPAEFLARKADYDRVLYQFGNSPFHVYQFDLLRHVPGVVILHDFYLSNVLQHMQLHTEGHTGVFYRALNYSHGWRAEAEARTSSVPDQTVLNYPCSKGVLDESLGTIVHSQHAKTLAMDWYSDGYQDSISVVPLPRVLRTAKDADSVQSALALDNDSLLICSFGGVTPSKLSDRLLEAWAVSKTSKDPKSKLVFVGSCGDPHFNNFLQEKIAHLGLASSVTITGWVNENRYQTFLSTADFAVQLRANSRGETSAAALDALSFALPVIANKNGAMNELPEHGCVLLEDGFEIEALADAIDALGFDRTKRVEMGKSGRDYVAAQHDPSSCAEQYISAIEQFYSAGLYQEKINAKRRRDYMEHVSAAAGESIAGGGRALSPDYKPETRQLLVDVSELAQRDAGSGIQRVVRNILTEWFRRPPDGFRVEPVYAELGTDYRYARKFGCNFLSLDAEHVRDEALRFYPGDVFIGLDLQPHVIPARQEFFSRLHSEGVSAKFVIYDILPITHPQYFFPGATQDFTKWLEVVTQSDGAACISKTVANDVSNWVRNNCPDRANSFEISSFHLGANIMNVDPEGESSLYFEELLVEMLKRPSLLMVGTVEPRKGHADILAAFDLLDAHGEDVNLVIVGKRGWMTEDLEAEIANHPKLNSRLFRIEGSSDAELSALYSCASALVAASYAEGFGLPLIEAAKHGVPIIARDIPVFREVAGEHAAYFQSGDPVQIADEICTWLSLYRDRWHRRSRGLSWLSWQESAKALTRSLGLEK